MTITQDYAVGVGEVWRITRDGSYVRMSYELVQESPWALVVADRLLRRYRGNPRREALHLNCDTWLDCKDGVAGIEIGLGQRDQHRVAAGWKCKVTA